MIFKPYIAIRLMLVGGQLNFNYFTFDFKELTSSHAYHAWLVTVTVINFSVFKSGHWDRCQYLNC